MNLLTLVRPGTASKVVLLPHPGIVGDPPPPTGNGNLPATLRLTSAQAEAVTPGMVTA